LRYVRFDFNHNYNQTSREAVYDWFGRWLLKNPDAASLKEQPHQKESDADLRVFPDGKIPDGALPMAKFIESLKRAHEAQWRALVPKEKRSFANFQEAILPAWTNTLQLHEEWNALRDGSIVHVPLAETRAWVVSEARAGGKILARAFGPMSKPSAAVIVPISVEDAGEFLEQYVRPGVFWVRPGALTQKIVGQSCTVFLLENADENHSADAFANFFTTYDRTALQERVRSIVSACKINRPPRGPNLVIIAWGKAWNGLAVLLAAPAADAVVADCSQVDATSDEVLLSHDLFCPGLRNLGTFEGAAMLAAPHPLLLHNVGEKFPTDGIRATYRALGASEKLRIETRKLSDEEIVEWISRLK
jgi:hypothetical protein